jgi:hypothetical protein
MVMDKFLKLCEEFDPINNGNPKLDLMDFLRSKGVNVSSVRDTDMLYIDIGEDVVAITVSMPEEDEQINAGTGTYEVDAEVEKLGNKAAKGLTGLMAKGLGTSAQKAKQAVKKREKVAADAVGAYEKGTDRIRKGLQKVKSDASNVGY